MEERRQQRKRADTNFPAWLLEEEDGDKENNEDEVFEDEVPKESIFDGQERFARTIFDSTLTIKLQGLDTKSANVEQYAKMLKSEFNKIKQREKIFLSY